LEENRDSILCIKNPLKGIFLTFNRKNFCDKNYNHCDECKENDLSGSIEKYGSKSEEEGECIDECSYCCF
jgi:hypothetical protein